VALRVAGPSEALRDPDLVASVKQHSDEVEALLAPGADAQQLLRRFIDAGAIVSKFEMVEPSLSDIFKDKVREV
jgi:ABC-type uncharacterized transport system ATPase subunit